MKKTFAPALLVFSLLLCGCRGKGLISASAIGPSVNDVTSLQTRFLRGEVVATTTSPQAVRLTESQTANALLASDTLKTTVDAALSTTPIGQ